MQAMPYAGCAIALHHTHLLQVEGFQIYFFYN